MLVGRERELEHLGARLAGDGLVVLVGPSGIGKTALGRALLAPFGGHREGGALANLDWSPLLVFRRLLRANPGESPDAVARAVLRHSTQPLLLDDLQWADDATLDVVARLRGRLPIIATVRTGEDRSEAVLGALALVGGHRSDLAALPDEAAAVLVARLHPELAATERDQLLAVAAGHPLLLTELPRGERGAPGLVSVLADRTAELGPSGREAFARLAVLGRPASAELLGAGADELVASGLATAGPDGIEIRHSMLAELEVERLGPDADAVRRSLADVVDPSEGAHLLAAAGDRSAARALALQAAEGAADRRSRAELLGLAVRCSDHVDFEQRVRAARLLTRTSQLAEARRLCAADGRDDLLPVERGALRLAEAEAAWSQGDVQGCARLLELGLADVEGTDTVWEVEGLAGSTVLHTFVEVDGRPALARARRAVALADRIGAGQGYARYRLAAVLATAEEPGWAEAYQEALQLAEEAQDRDLRRDVVVGQLLAHWVHGSVDAAEALARRELARPGVPGDEVSRLTITAYAAVLGLLVGRTRTELLEEFRPVLDAEPAFRGRAFLEAAVLLALADEGRHAEAEALAVGAEVRAGIDAQFRAVALWGVVEAAWSAGRWADAVEGQAIVSSLHLGDHPGALCMARLIGAHAAVDGGGRPAGAGPVRPAPGWRAASEEWAGLEARAEGRFAEAADRFLAAAAGWAVADRRSEARAAWAAGDALIGIDRERAVVQLTDAEVLAEAAGARPIVERARRSLRSVGVARRAPTVSSIGGLTGREVEVLDLVGTGSASGAIATTLGVELSTVESLIRSAMRKLDAPTRAAAVARLADLRSAAARPTA